MKILAYLVWWLVGFFGTPIAFAGNLKTKKEPNKKYLVFAFIIYLPPTILVLILYLLIL